MGYYDRLNALNTSDEILEAIETLTGYEFGDCDENAEQSDDPAYCLWRDSIGKSQSGNEITSDDVVKLAWSLADPDEDTLFWGCSRFTRNI